MTQTTVTATVNHSGASRVIKLNGAVNADGVIPLAVGSNVITVEVTAEDGSATRTYTVTVTRALSTNASLRVLSLSNVDFGSFVWHTDGIQRPRRQQRDADGGNVYPGPLFLKLRDQAGRCC